MEIILLATNKRVRKKINKDLYWYDPIEKKTLHGRGGRIQLFYDTNQKKMVPRIMDDFEWIYERNYDNLENWIKINHHNIQSVSHRAKGNSITIHIDAQNFDTIEADLRDNDIQYEYDEKELISESKNKVGKKWQNSILKWPIHPLH